MQRIFPRALAACILEAWLPRVGEIYRRKRSEVSPASAEHSWVTAALGCEVSHLDDFTRQRAA